VFARLWHGAVALLVLAGLVVQCVIAVRASGSPSGHAVGTLAGASITGRFLRVASFFTIQSNILVGITSAQLARRPDRDGAMWRVVRLNALVGIAVTGIVYSTVLARMHEPKGWEQTSSNFVFHYAVPVLAVVGWFLLGPRPRIDANVVRWSLLWPVLWFCYTLVHGRISKWYPYPFVDVTTHGYGRVLLNAVLVTLVLGAVSSVFAIGDDRLRRAPDPVAIRS
jgi:uncharacterized membrane protein